jgi:hypothetical protein
VAFIRENSFIQPDGQPNIVGHDIINEDLVDDGNDEINIDDSGRGNEGN